jgi:putative transposase
MILGSLSTSKTNPSTGDAPMPRANRYILPGYVYHLTHRCHNRKFLLRSRLDRIEYCSRLESSARKHRISLFGFCITCNHVHLLGTCDRLNDLSRFMQQLEGEFAQYYNFCKHRSGAFWGERFHCTMIDGGDHLWNCLRYIDLNMVRAGVVGHPSEWEWCSYQELVGKRKHSCLLDIDRLADLLGLSDPKALAEIHQQRIFEAIKGERLIREKIWTESIAVGRECFLREIAAKNKKRKRLYMGVTEDGAWHVRENRIQYARSYDLEKGS